MKIGILSDLHLGHKQYGLMERENDFYKQFQKCCSKLNELNTDVVIIAGDIFDKPNPSPFSMHQYIDGIRSLNAEYVIAIKGNHTMLQRKNHYSADRFFFDNHIQGYYLLEDDSIFIEDKVRIDGITYRPDSQLDDFIEKQKEIGNVECDDSIYRILITHQAYSEFCGFTNVSLSIDDINLSPYDMIINGHIHSHLLQKYQETVFLQPGSIERLNIAEAIDEEENGKGVWLLDVDENNLSFYPIKPERKFFHGDICIKSKRQLNKVFENSKQQFKNEENKPIVAYNYHDEVGNSQLIRDMIISLSEYVLRDNSNIYGQESSEITVEITDSEIPTIVQSLGLVEDLDDDERKLSIDIYNALKEERQDISNLLETFRKKKYAHKENKEYIEKTRQEIKEFEEFFDKL